MTKTLLKHEWLRTRGVVATILGLGVLLAVLGGMLGMTGWPLLSGLGYVIATLAVLALVPVLQLGLVVDYWRSGYGRTGYFTQSLPIRGAAIYWTKLAWALLMSLAALLLTVVLGFFVWWAVSLQSQVPAPTADMIGEAWSGLTGVAPGWMIAAGALLFLGSFLIWPVYYYFAVSIGHESRLSGLGVGGPIVVFVLLYVGMQLLSFLGMVALPFGIGPENDGLGLVAFNLTSELTMEPGGGGGDVMPLGFLVPMALIAVYCLWRTVRSWNHKVALA